MFFNTKRFELVDLTNQAILEIDSVNTLVFYIKDIILNTPVQSASFMVSSKSGRDIVTIQPYMAITNITGDVFRVSYTPDILTVDKELIIRIKVIDQDGAEHLLITNSYTTTLK